MSEISISYELDARELARGLRASRRFRRQVVLLSLLAVPSLVVLGMWPNFRWWMVPPLVALLAYRALQVPARTARRTLPGGRAHPVRLEASESRLAVSGALVAKATWSEVKAASATPHDVILELRDGPVIVIPTRALDRTQQDLLLEYGKRD